MSGGISGGGGVTNGGVGGYVHTYSILCTVQGQQTIELHTALILCLRHHCLKTAVNSMAIIHTVHIYSGFYCENTHC